LKKPDLWSLYRQMFRIRLFEEAVARLWEEGLISGEMHMGTGEEAIMAGVLDHLSEGDAMALDHRGTSGFLIRGIDPVLLLMEFLGHSGGLCKGRGGHMHLFSKEHLAASSGIVGASGPSAVGFALAAQQLRPKSISVAFFGEGAINQGMMMESLNLAVVWKLPVLFVCKDNDWAITTRSSQVTGGSIVDRAKSFGMSASEVDGSAVEDVWHAADKALKHARSGGGPSFIRARCIHLEGHFLGDPLLRVTRQPVKEMKEMSGPLVGSATQWKGASIYARADSLRRIAGLIVGTFKDQIFKKGDPLKLTREKLQADKNRLKDLEESAKNEIKHIIETASKLPDKVEGL
jgi:TPP-dependent pyruvate/acetoin dehydrogenase alpha subunit